MPLLSQLDVNGLQSLMGSIYDRVALVQQDTRTSDGQGGSTSNWQTLYAAMPCMYTILGLKLIKEEIIAQQNLGKLKKSLLYPTTYLLKGSERVTIAGITYTVIDAPNDMSYAPFFTALIEPLEEDE